MYKQVKMQKELAKKKKEDRYKGFDTIH